MKDKNLLKMGQYYVEYLNGVTALYPNQTEFGRSIGFGIPRGPTLSASSKPKGNNGSRHNVLITPASGVTPIQMKAYDHAGSAISGMSAPLIHHH
ncbi:MAG: hypothetical protein ACOH1Q_08245 [Thiobacillus sp.]